MSIEIALTPMPVIPKPVETVQVAQISVPTEPIPDLLKRW
jgi:hypothetical protein